MNGSRSLREAIVRRALWAMLVAAAVMVARRVAAGVWRRTTGEEPPAQA